MLAKIRNFLAAFAVVALAAGAVATDPALAQNVTIQNQTDGSKVVTLSNGTQVTVPSSLASQLDTALATTDPQQLQINIQNLIQNNAATNPDLAEALVAIALNEKTDSGDRVAIIVGATQGNPGAKQRFVNLGVNAGGLTLEQINLAFSLNDIAPAAGVTETGTVTITEVNTAENPAQASGTT